MGNQDLQFFRSLRDPGEINRYLFIALGMGEGTPPVFRRKRLRKAFRQWTSKGYIVSFEEVTSALEFLGLISAKDGSLELKLRGLTFLRKNPQQFYDLTEDQRSMMVHFLLLGREEASMVADELVRGLSYNRETERYEWAVSELGQPKTDLNFRLFLSGLGFLKADAWGSYYIDSSFTSALSRKIKILRLTTENETLVTEEVLERSRHAEELVRVAEVDRLEGLRRTDLAERVDVVGDYDTAIGFDILSYQGGNSRPEEYDRFIEVKSSVGQKVRFSFTFNEMKTARHYADRYVIAFLGAHDIGRTLTECIHVEIENPSESIFDTARFEVDARKFYIRAR